MRIEITNSQKVVHFIAKTALLVLWLIILTRLKILGLSLIYHDDEMTTALKSWLMYL